MRKIIEFALVFLLGWGLALYVIDHEQSKTISKTSTQQEPIQHSNDTRPDTLTAQPSPQLPRPPSRIQSLPSSTARPDPAKVKQQLAQGQTDLLMEVLRTSPEGPALQNYRAVFFGELQNLKQRKQYQTAIDWLTAYLQVEYDDVSALQALADFHYLQTNYLAAIDTLYLAKSYAHEIAKSNQIVARLRAITQQYATQLKRDNNNLALLDLYQRLVSVEPEYSAHYIGLAQAYVALGNEYDARRTLNIIAYDPDNGAKAKQLLTLMEQRSQQEAANAEPIALTRRGNSLVAEVLFDNRAYGRLLVDTGASLTVISPQLLQDLALDYGSPQRRAWFNTANGVIEAPIFIIDRVSVGAQSIDHMEVAVMDLDNHNINGLLGMNFLRHFRFSIDQQKNVLYLSPRN